MDYDSIIYGGMPRGKGQNYKKNPPTNNTAPAAAPAGPDAPPAGSAAPAGPDAPPTNNTVPAAAPAGPDAPPAGSAMSAAAPVAPPAAAPAETDATPAGSSAPVASPVGPDAAAPAETAAATTSSAAAPTAKKEEDDTPASLFGLKKGVIQAQVLTSGDGLSTLRTAITKAQQKSAAIDDSTELRDNDKRTLQQVEQLREYVAASLSKQYQRNSAILDITTEIQTALANFQKASHKSIRIPNLNIVHGSSADANVISAALGALYLLMLMKDKWQKEAPPSYIKGPFRDLYSAVNPSLLVGFNNVQVEADLVTAAIAPVRGKLSKGTDLNSDILTITELLATQWHFFADIPVVQHTVKYQADEVTKSCEKANDVVKSITGVISTVEVEGAKTMQHLLDHETNPSFRHEPPCEPTEWVEYDLGTAIGEYYVVKLPKDQDPPDAEVQLHGYMYDVVGILLYMMDKTFVADVLHDPIWPLMIKGSEPVDEDRDHLRAAAVVLRRRAKVNCSSFVTEAGAFAFDKVTKDVVMVASSAPDPDKCTVEVTMTRNDPGTTVPISELFQNFTASTLSAAKEALHKAMMREAGASFIVPDSVAEYQAAFVAHIAESRPNLSPPVPSIKHVSQVLHSMTRDIGVIIGNYKNGGIAVRFRTRRVDHVPLKMLYGAGWGPRGLMFSYDLTPGTVFMLANKFYTAKNFTVGKLTYTEHGNRDGKEITEPINDVVSKIKTENNGRLACGTLVSTPVFNFLAVVLSSIVTSTCRYYIVEYLTIGQEKYPTSLAKRFLDTAPSFAEILQAATDDARNFGVFSAQELTRVNVAPDSTPVRGSRQVAYSKVTGIMCRILTSITDSVRNQRLYVVKPKVNDKYYDVQGAMSLVQVIPSDEIGIVPAGGSSISDDDVSRPFDIYNPAPGPRPAFIPLFPSSVPEPVEPPPEPSETPPSPVPVTLDTLHQARAASVNGPMSRSTRSRIHPNSAPAAPIGDTARAEAQTSNRSDSDNEAPQMPVHTGPTRQAVAPSATAPADAPAAAAPAPAATAPADAPAAATPAPGEDAPEDESVAAAPAAAAPGTTAPTLTKISNAVSARTQMLHDTLVHTSNRLGERSSSTEQTSEAASLGSVHNPNALLAKAHYNPDRSVAPKRPLVTWNGVFGRSNNSKTTAAPVSTAPTPPPRFETLPQPGAGRTTHRTRRRNLNTIMKTLRVLKRA